jgi:hypothetical protein
VRPAVVIDTETSASVRRRGVENRDLTDCGPRIEATREMRQAVDAESDHGVRAPSLRVRTAEQESGRL